MRYKFPGKIVAIIVINIEPKKSMSMSKTLCCVIRGTKKPLEESEKGE